MQTDNIERFLEMQSNDYKKALEEIRGGQKRSHWMWYIFPQVRGLGFTEISVYYSIKSIEEAKEYINHPILGLRLREITEALLRLQSNNAIIIMGNSDALKLRSSMTLFASLPNTDPLFQKVLDKFYGGEPDINTLEIIESWKSV